MSYGVVRKSEHDDNIATENVNCQHCEFLGAALLLEVSMHTCFQEGIFPRHELISLLSWLHPSTLNGISAFSTGDPSGLARAAMLAVPLGLR